MQTIEYGLNDMIRKKERSSIDNFKNHLQFHTLWCEFLKYFVAQGDLGKTFVTKSWSVAAILI